jgi:dihydroorotate dehydrogenase (fumarate)
MIDLSVKYLGLDLKNPLIIGSSGLTNSIEDIIGLQNKGAAAIVLKSIFEEEIHMEYAHELKQVAPDENNLEYYDYLDYKIKDDVIQQYIKLVKSCKEHLEIPVIASINCRTVSEWTFFAKKVKEAGADAIELNVFNSPSEPDLSAQDAENTYFKLIEAIRKEVKIPLSIKISHYFSNLASVIKRLSETDVQGLVLFNRFYSPDFDIENLKVIPSHILSSPEDMAISLRWIALMSKNVSCDLAASTGIHNGQAMIKQLLAGAAAVQVVSTVYKNGKEQIPIILNELVNWMQRKGYQSVSDFRGAMASSNLHNPSILERVQFMKYFGEFSK